MTESIIVALIAAGVTLVTTVVTSLVNTYIDKNKRCMEERSELIKTKQEKLGQIYQELIQIINHYPNQSPLDCMRNIEYAPGYSMESFDATIQSLKYQIENDEHILGRNTIDFNKENELRIAISNRKYAIKRIEQIRDDYFMACDKYKRFCETDKNILDLYASQAVKNSLVYFDVVIHNVFISGYSVGDADDTRYNKIDNARREIVQCMRQDIGIK